MSTARFAGRGDAMTMIAPHATGHQSEHGTLLRVDCERGSIRDAALVVMAIAWQCGIRPPHRRGRP
jgi:hypothetical protein